MKYSLYYTLKLKKNTPETLQTKIKECATESEYITRAVRKRTRRGKKKKKKRRETLTTVQTSHLRLLPKKGLPHTTAAPN